MKTVTASANRELDELLDLIGLSVQLTPSQFEKAETSYHAVAKWLQAPDSPVRVYSPDIFAQGSLRLDTTVRPMRHTEFDLDLVCLVQMSEQVSPAVVYGLLLKRMRAHGTYDKIISACKKISPQFLEYLLATTRKRGVRCPQQRFINVNAPTVYQATLTLSRKCIA